MYVGKSALEISKFFSKKTGKDCFEELLKDKREFYRKLQEKGIPPIQPTLDFLHQLAKEKTRRNIFIGMASSLSKNEILLHLDHLRIQHYFDVILSGSDDLQEYIDPEGVNKPKPYIYLHAAKILGVFPYECVVIEDTITGVTAGLDAGCLTVAVPNYYSRYHDFSKAHLKLESFSNICVEDFLKKIEDLRAF